MGQTNTDQIIAHADLLRSIDRLLSQAEIVRKKREALDRLLSESTNAPSPYVAKEEARHEP
jgi:hypothetical protein